MSFCKGWYTVMKKEGENQFRISKGRIVGGTEGVHPKGYDWVVSVPPLTRSHMEFDQNFTSKYGNEPVVAERNDPFLGNLISRAVKLHEKQDTPARIFPPKGALPDGMSGMNK